ncbi:diguanylate cyclase domain-containing protein [Methanobrevibacter sp.]|uniref:diguanylate cyclase domain-containing protein n=1 Tax=Methanobrevibacter sp. TaxID=66852 RepID=UPI00388D0EAE
MFHKKVVVIDDVGDFFEELSDAFHDDLEIIIKCVNSDFESLKQFLKRDTYMILINMDGLKTDLMELVDFIQNNLFFLALPIMVISDDEDFVGNPPKLGSLLFNSIPKPSNMDDLKSLLDFFIEILEYNRNINDISGLPGNKIISSKLLYEISQNTKFAFVFLDLDKFKEFGEYFGLYKASQVIYILANIIDQSIKKYGSFEDFIGHVGGDDFILILKDYRSADVICNDIIAKFDEKILEFYSEEDLERRYIETINRSGEVERFSIMTISVVSMNYTDFKNQSFDQVFRSLNEIKKKTKLIEGSVMLKS